MAESRTARLRVHAEVSREAAGSLALAAGFLVIPLLVAVNVWIAVSVLAPVVRDARVDDHVFVPASLAWLAGAWAASGTSLWILWRFRTRHREPLRTGELGAVALWSLLLLLPVGVLFVPASGEWTVLWYVIADLRWVWWVSVVGAVLAPLWPGLRSTVASRPRLVRLLPVGTLIVAPVALAIVATPLARFRSAMGGDEPKYLRYCENLYQGRGFEISQKRLLTDPAAGPPNLWGNVREFGRAVREEFPLVLDDLSRVVGLPAAPRLVGGQPNPGLFFEGKHRGTLYQLHNPGLSFLLFPAYYVDRRWTGSGIGYQEEFPENLPATNAMLLALYAAYGVAVYALLQRASIARPVAWAVSMVSVVALPAGAFAFQIYPEVAAGILLTVVAARLVGEREMNVLQAMAYGSLVGFLPWLHVRFGLATVLLACWALGRRRDSTRARAGFQAGVLLGFGALCAYTYRLTGNAVPLSVYGSSIPLTAGRLIHGLFGFAFDSTFGFLPHAPLFLLALPGIALAWRRRRDLALLALLLVAAVVAPGAGHGYWAAGATPSRYLVAAIPFVALFLAASTGRWSGRKGFVAAWAFLAAVSFETSLRYNLHHWDVGKLVTTDFSGWRLNLLFPSLGSGWALTPADWALLATWLVVCAALFAMPLWLRVRGSPETTGIAFPMPRHLLGCSLIMVAVGIPVAAASGRCRSADYLPSADEVREQAFLALPRQRRCALCYSSRTGRVEPTVALGNHVAAIRFEVDPPSPDVGTSVRVRVRPREEAGSFVLGDLLVDFGDGTARRFPDEYGDVTVEHAYAQPGEFRLRAGLRARSDGSMFAETTVVVRRAQ